MNRLPVLWPAIGLIALVSWPTVVRGQEPPNDSPRVQELIERIREAMHDVDRILLGGKDPVRAAGRAEDAARKLDELLDEAESRSRAVVAGLEELIELARPPS